MAPGDTAAVLARAAAAPAWTPLQARLGLPLQPLSLCTAVCAQAQVTLRHTVAVSVCALQDCMVVPSRYRLWSCACRSQHASTSLIHEVPLHLPYQYALFMPLYALEWCVTTGPNNLCSPFCCRHAI